MALEEIAEELDGCRDYVRQCYEGKDDIWGLNADEFLPSDAGRSENFAIYTHNFSDSLEDTAPTNVGRPQYGNHAEFEDFCARMRAERLATVFRAGRWDAFNPDYWKIVGPTKCEGLPRLDAERWKRLSKAIATKLRHAPMHWERATVIAYEDARLRWDDFVQWAKNSRVCNDIALTHRNDEWAATRVLTCIAQQYSTKDRLEIFWYGGVPLALRAIQGHSAGGIGGRANPFACGWKQLLASQDAPYLYHTVSTSDRPERVHRGASGLTPAERLTLIMNEGIRPGIDAAGDGSRLHAYFSARNPLEEFSDKADDRR